MERHTSSGGKWSSEVSQLGWEREASDTYHQGHCDEEAALHANATKLLT